MFFGACILEYGHAREGAVRPHDAGVGSKIRIILNDETLRLYVFPGRPEWSIFVTKPIWIAIFSLPTQKRPERGSKPAQQIPRSEWALAPFDLNRLKAVVA